MKNFFNFFVKLCGYGYVVGLIVLILHIFPMFIGYLGALISFGIIAVFPLAGSSGIIPHIFLYVLTGVPGALEIYIRENFNLTTSKSLIIGWSIGWVIYYVTVILAILIQYIITKKFFVNFNKNNRRHWVFKFACVHHLGVCFVYYYYFNLCSNWPVYWSIYSLSLNLIVGFSVLMWMRGDKCLE